MDDPEHISVDGYGDTLYQAVEEVLEEIKLLIRSSDDGRILKEGIQTVIVGKPNAGKSSLLNVLSGHDRAIVTDIAGTTRDILEEQIQLQGLSLNIIDTAGIRETEDIIERMGVERAKEYANKADLVIWVIDASCPFDESDEEILELISDKKSVILLNKIDLNVMTSKEYLLCKLNSLSDNSNELEIPIIEISVKEERGISELEEVIQHMFFEGEISFNDEVYITNIRQKAALQAAEESLVRVMESIENQMPEDFYSIDLMDAYESLGNITGETIGEDLVNEIFSKFCMGK